MKKLAGAPRGIHDAVMAEGNTTATTMREALPTRVHAEMVFDQVVDLLGPAAWIDTFNGRTRRVLFRRDASDPDLLVPWPIASLDLRGRVGTIVGLDGKVETELPTRPGQAPRLRGLGPGEITLYDGARSVTVTYGNDGRWVETVNDAQPDIAAVLARKKAPPPELLSAWLASLDPGRHGPARLVASQPFPAGLANLHEQARGFVQDALFHARIPLDAAWAAADALTGEALAWEATRKEALAAWRSEVERTRPWPRKSEAPSTERLEELAAEFGGFVLHGPEPDVPLPERTAANVPGVIVPLATFADRVPPLGRWRRLLGARGATSRHLLLDDPRGFTLISESVLDAADFSEIESRLEMAEKVWDGADPDKIPWPTTLPPPQCCVTTYQVADPATGSLVPPRALLKGRLVEFQAASLDGDELKGKVYRLRWIKE